MNPKIQATAFAEALMFLTIIVVMIRLLSGTPLSWIEKVASGILLALMAFYRLFTAVRDLRRRLALKSPPGPEPELPRRALSFLLILPYKAAENVETDLLDGYKLRLARHGKMLANRWFRSQVFWAWLSLGGAAIKSITRVKIFGKVGELVHKVITK